MLVIVPDILADKITKKINDFITKYPHQEKNRNNLYRDLIIAYNKFGVIADIEDSREEQ